MTAIPLETCRLAKEAGFPQDRWPQMVWASIGLGRFEIHYYTHPRATDIHPEWYAAPSPLDLLEWLEAEKGWDWWRQSPRERAVTACWFANHSDGKQLLASADTAADLCLAVLQRLVKP